MRKRKVSKVIAIFLCAVILFSSESMSCLTYATSLTKEDPSITTDAEDSENDIPSDEGTGTVEAPDEEDESPDIQEDLPDSADEPDVSEDSSGESVTPSDDEEQPPVNGDADDITTTDPDQQETSETEEEYDTTTGSPEDTDIPEPEIPSVSENNDVEEEESVDQNEQPVDSVSDNTVSANTLGTLVTASELTDFVIVDEGGNVLDETQTIYLDQDKTRKLSVRPTPEDAVYSDVLWTSDNSRVSVTNGTVALVPAADDSVENVSLTATITAQIGEISKTCKVEFLPLVEDVVIVDQDGNEVPETGLTIEMGEQKKLSVKVLPEGASADVSTLWRSDNIDLEVNYNGIMHVHYLPNSLPVTCHVSAEVTVSNMLQKTTIKKEIPVTIVAPSEEKLLCGDIQFFCSGMGTIEKINDTTWNATIDDRSSLNRNVVTLSYTGAESKYTIFYKNDAGDLSVGADGWVNFGAKIYDEKRGIKIDPNYPLKVMVGTGGYTSYHPEKHSPVYTIRFTACKTELSLSRSTIETIPAGGDQELIVTQLPDGAKVEDIVWTSGDERIVRIKGKTENGVMLQFGQIVGLTKITATVKDHKGQNRYAACTVKISMQVPMPEFSSESGGEMWEELPNGDYNYYWLIDKGGKLEMSVKGIPGAKIYYTTNGTDPAVYGKLYQVPITINAKTKVRACAKLEGYQDSWDWDSEFRIGNPKISVSPTAVTMPQNSTRRIKATVPSWADPDDIYYESSNDEIAYVDYEDIENSEGDIIDSRLVIFSNESGAAGTCIITASYYDYAGREQTATCRVTVTGKLEVAKSITMTEESSAEIRITKMPAGVRRDEISWYTYNSDDYKYINIETAPNGNGLITVGHLPDTSEPQTILIYASATLMNNSDDALDWDFSDAYCEVTIIPKQYTVRFLGWNDKPAKTESLGRGQNATPPEDALMRAAAPEGYLFDGWQNLADCKNITKDTDIYAKPYVQTPFSITYMTGSEGSNPAANPVSYKASDNTITLSDAVPADSTVHKFAGWYRNSQYDGSPIDEISSGTTGDLILYAKWVTAKTGLRIEPIADQPYTGKAIKPEVEVYDGETLLTLGTDYTVAYKNNTNACMQPWADPKKAPAVTVRGKGNYGGSDTETFQIVPQSIALDSAEVVIPDLHLAYTGKALKIAPVVTWNGKKLSNKDFEVTTITDNEDLITVTECIDEGFYTVTIAGKGNYTGTRDISLTVTTKTLLSKVSFKPAKLKDIPWADLQGKTLGETDIQVDEGVILKKGSDELIKDVDYTVTYDTSAKEAGTYTAVFAGMGDTYSGTVTKTFKITGKPIASNKVEIQGLGGLTYNGVAQTPDVTVIYKDGKIPMKPGIDYTLTYDNNVNAGKKASITITGINGYTGTMKKTFQILPYPLADKSAPTQQPVKIFIASRNNYYEKGGAKPKISVMYQDTLLAEGRDYTVKYKNNTKAADVSDAKPPTFTVTGKGNFTGSVSMTFSILPQDISRLSITAEDVMAAAPNQKKGETIGLTARGKYKSTPKITDFNGKALSAGTDFLKSYTITDENGIVLGPKDQVPEGSILTITVQGTKNYTGEIKTSYRVLAAKKSVAKASVALKKDVIKEYSLEPVTLKKDDLIVKLNGAELSKEHYTIVSYVNNRKKGTAKVTIQGVGEYGGRKTVNFNIKPKQITWFKTP